LKIAAERLRGNDLQIAEYIDLLIRTQKKIRKGHQSKYQSNELQLAFMECWESLDPITQEFLACISLCARTGFSSRTAAEITEITDRDEVNDLLDFLESRSLINWCGGIGKRHERAKLHALFRNFCNDQANRLNLVSSTLEKHSNWFSQWLESIGITSEEAADQMLIDPAIVDQIAEDLDDIIIASEWVYKQPSFSDHYQFSSIPAQTERLFPVLAHFCHWDKALRLVEKLRKWSQNSCDHERVARFGMHEARFLSKLGKQENAIEILEEICIPSAKLISDPGERAARESKIYNVAGGIHEIRKDRSNAINAFLINAQIDEGIGDYRSLAIVANRLGTNYRLLDSSFEALSWFNKQLSLAEYLLDVRMQRSAWNGISLIHKSLGDYDQELYSLNQEIELSSQCGDQRALALALSRLGHLHLSRKQHKEAVEWYKQAISISPETIGQASFYIQLGKARMELKENSKALLCFKKAIWISSKHNDIENKIRGICQLGILFYENREFVKAYTFFNMSLDLDLLSTEHIRHRKTIQSLAFYLSKDGFHFEAKAICDKLVKLLSGSPEYLDTLAKTYKVMGFSYSFRNLHLLAYNSFQKSYLLYFELDGKPAKLIKPMYSLLRSIKAAGSPHEKVIETSLKIDSLSVRMLWVLYVLGSDIIYKSSVGEFTLIDFLIKSAKDAKIFLWQEIGQSIKQMRSAEHGCNSVALMIEHSCSRISGQVQTIREREICSECIHSLAISRRNTADSLRLRSESTYKNLLYAEAEYFSHITLLLTTRNCEARIKGLNTLASIARRRQDTQLSQQCLREAFDLSVSYPSLQMQVASHLGYVIAMQGNTDPDCYLRYIEHGIMLAENLADKRHLCIAHGQFAEVIQARLLDADAMAHLIISWENACLVDPLRRTTLEWAATNLVSFLLSQGKLVDAERFCSHSLNILPNDLTLSQLLDKIIEYRESGKRPTALIRTGESISVSTGTNNPLQDRLFIEEDDYDGELFEYDDIFSD
jgi:tetratricopeptide (TPR) repeat protein